jgi:hypothetical protein
VVFLHPSRKVEKPDVGAGTHHDLHHAACQQVWPLPANPISAPQRLRVSAPLRWVRPGI